MINVEGDSVDVLPIPIGIKENYYSGGPVFVSRVQYEKQLELLSQGQFDAIVGSNLLGSPEEFEDCCSLEFFSAARGNSQQGSLIIATEASGFGRNATLYVPSGEQYRLKAVNLVNPSVVALIALDEYDAALALFCATSIREIGKPLSVELQMAVLEEPIRLSVQNAAKSTVGGNLHAHIFYNSSDTGIRYRQDFPLVFATDYFNAHLD